MTELTLSVKAESWPIAGTFTISRGSKTDAHVVIATLSDGDHIGWGECVPYARYGETIDSVGIELESCCADVLIGMSHEELPRRLPAGAARNALDCAYWDYRAKKEGRPVWQLANLPEPQPLTTAYTISLANPDTMNTAARTARHMPVLKVKLGGDALDFDRVKAVKDGAPKSKLIVDANEAWTMERLRGFAPKLHELGVVLIEQPLPADRDSGLVSSTSPVPLCADESAHDRSNLTALSHRYDYINIKLDKTGGLTEAIALANDARTAGLGIMVGCMVSTSLSMAPASLLGSLADYVDLDGPLLLAKDRAHPIQYKDGTFHPPSRDLWG